MHNELIKLVESTNIELQEKELKLIKEEGLKRLDKLEESVKKLEEGFGRGVVGRQMAALPTSDESKLFRLGKMLKDAGSPEEAEEIKKEIKKKRGKKEVEVFERGKGSRKNKKK